MSGVFAQHFGHGGIAGSLEGVGGATRDLRLPGSHVTPAGTVPGADAARDRHAAARNRTDGLAHVSAFVLHTGTGLPGAGRHGPVSATMVPSMRTAAQTARAVFFLNI